MLYTVIMVLVIVTLVAIFSTRKQTEILNAQGKSIKDMGSANRNAIEYSAYTATAGVVCIVLTMLVLFHLRRSQEELKRHSQNLEREYRKREEALQESIGRETQAQLQAQRQSEIVDRLLHSIGNAINSVTVGLDTIRINMADRALTHHLRSLANAVKEHQDAFGDYIEDDVQGQKVAQFITALADDFEEHDKELAETAERVYERAEHIADIIRETRQY